MIVNLYVDHMMNRPPASAEEVWVATNEHSREFKEAARQIGLTPAEYKEFRNSLLEGNALYVRLPHKFTAMAGDRHGYVYAVHHAVLPRNSVIYGWEIKLKDGSSFPLRSAASSLV